MKQFNVRNYEAVTNDKNVQPVGKKRYVLPPKPQLVKTQKIK